jgi:hypothetical protein
VSGLNFIDSVAIADAVIANWMMIPHEYLTASHWEHGSYAAALLYNATIVRPARLIVDADEIDRDFQ